jgi:hypothetical protein
MIETYYFLDTGQPVAMGGDERPGRSARSGGSHGSGGGAHVVVWVIGVMFFVVAASLAVRAAGASPNREAAYLFDTALITVAVLALSAYCARAAARVQGVSEEAGAVETFAEAEAPTTVGVEETVAGDIATALAVYVSCFSAASYTAEAGSKVWQNVAHHTPATPNGSKATTTCSADGTVRDLNFTFAVAPSFSPKSGFALGRNTVTGPYSHQLGISGDMAFSAFVVFQPTGVIEERSDGSGDGASHDDALRGAVVFRLFANTVNNNGCSLVLRGAGERQAGLIPVSAVVQLGNEAPFECTPARLLLDPARRYVWAVCKDYSRMCVYMADLDADGCAPVRLLDAPLVAVPPLSFSNRDMTLNERANWPANMLCFGLYARSLVAQDVAGLCVHYRGLLRRFDPAYAALMDKMGEAAALRACPYDARTCKACGGVQDWTDTAAVVAAGETCRTYIDRFCTATPQHPRCACWNAANPEYDASCRHYRTLFNGEPGACDKPEPEPEPEPKPEPKPNPKDDGGGSRSSDDDDNGDGSKHHKLLRGATALLSEAKAGKPGQCGATPRQRRPRRPRRQRCPHKHVHERATCPHKHDGDASSSEDSGSDGEAEAEAGGRRPMRAVRRTTFWDWLGEWRV